MIVSLSSSIIWTRLPLIPITINKHTFKPQYQSSLKREIGNTGTYLFQNPHFWLPLRLCSTFYREFASVCWTFQMVWLFRPVPRVAAKSSRSTTSLSTLTHSGSWSSQTCQSARNLKILDYYKLLKLIKSVIGEYRLVLRNNITVKFNVISDEERWGSSLNPTAYLDHSLPVRPGWLFFDNTGSWHRCLSSLLLAIRLIRASAIVIKGRLVYHPGPCPWTP